MKGILKSFEALVAILLVLTAYFALFTEEKVPDVETVIWRLKGIEALKALDDSNELVNYVLANESEKIESKLGRILPIGLDYKVVVCDQTCIEPNISSEKIVSVGYFIGGNATHVEPREIWLYLWRGR
ncbi:MAG: hypothetical protein QW040_01400 [Candidatus Aenigmatarchaeota archaeon]